MLNQKNSEVVKGFFNRATFLQLFVSDFSLFSIGIIHLREKKLEKRSGIPGHHSNPNRTRPRYSQ